ncbi:MAG: CDP-diacylglycerol--serine O-phosphatidyltransferase [Ignavibacteriae bacterium]|nr:CDP-diacylglycerol--serine O-phosphatidyltransferase [Ignavibacteriota bacterium]
MKITRAVVPSLFTVLNIFCGFRAIVETAQGAYILASWFIVLAALFDTLDGIMARITKSYSDFGVEFDSLSDVVSFGVAPSFLVYSIHLHTLQGLGMIVSAMPMVFGAMRLARFNAQVTGYDKDFFKGLPIPAAAVTISSFIQTFYHEGIGIQGIEASILAPMVAGISFLMISVLKYDNVPKFTKYGIKQHPLRFTIGIAGLTAILVTQGRALFPFFVFYVATGPLRYIVHFIQHALHPVEKVEEGQDTEVTGIDV